MLESATRSVLGVVESVFSAQGAVAGFRRLFGALGDATDAEAAVESTFAELDTDGDGLVSKAEIRDAIVKRFDERLNAEALAAMFDAADADGDGNLTLAEVKAILQSPAHPEAESPAQKARPAAASESDSPVPGQKLWLAGEEARAASPTPGSERSRPKMKASFSDELVRVVVPPTAEAKTTRTAAATAAEIAAWPPDEGTGEGDRYPSVPSTIGGLTLEAALHHAGKLPSPLHWTRALPRPARIFLALQLVTIALLVGAASVYIGATDGTWFGGTVAEFGAFTLYACAGGGLALMLLGLFIECVHLIRRCLGVCTLACVVAVFFANEGLGLAIVALLAQGACWALFLGPVRKQFSWRELSRYDGSRAAASVRRGVMRMRAALRVDLICCLLHLFAAAALPNVYASTASALANTSLAAEAAAMQEQVNLWQALSLHPVASPLLQLLFQVFGICAFDLMLLPKIKSLNTPAAHKVLMLLFLCNGLLIVWSSIMMFLGWLVYLSFLSHDALSTLLDPPPAGVGIVGFSVSIILLGITVGRLEVFMALRKFRKAQRSRDKRRSGGGFLDAFEPPPPLPLSQFTALRFGAYVKMSIVEHGAKEDPKERTSTEEDAPKALPLKKRIKYAITGKKTADKGSTTKKRFLQLSDGALILRWGWHDFIDLNTLHAVRLGTADAPQTLHLLSGSLNEGFKLATLEFNKPKVFAAWAAVMCKLVESNAKVRAHDALHPACLQPTHPPPPAPAPPRL